MSNQMESFHLNEQVPEDKKIEIVPNPEIYYNEVDSQTKSFIDKYKKELENVENGDEKENLRLKLINQINSLEKERNQIWEEIDTNEGYPESELILQNDLAKQLTTNINELGNLLNSK